ncbi:Predicted DNA binding protein, contains HTH domain [Haladaptatus litoreus]|uniref:Predicted DNA binding protein, contains HTH domain n=1 Tax=Haladaptatus litoreus TaxID=553468 RepID=A0A1N7DZN8_9EURY|nr:helix-turn-helix domain-containing protein [Haladaptatus litoreus]SIR81251.1 Predicted DNA binding protein, contains HTH domain [Haladaptatus litoreus]
MIIVEFRLDYPVLRDALSRAPKMKLTWEQSDRTEEGRHKLLFWTEGGDFEAFEDALEEDSTVTTPSRTIELGEQRLYQTELKGEARRTSIYPLLVNEASILQRVTATHDGWEFRAAFPDREAFGRFRDFCREHEIEFVVHRFYEEREHPDTPRFGLTGVQRETLVMAVECGYLEIPRESSLADLSDEFDISETAASERFRRGVKTLIECTVCSDNEQS